MNQTRNRGKGYHRNNHITVAEKHIKRKENLLNVKCSSNTRECEDQC